MVLVFPANLVKPEMIDPAGQKQFGRHPHRRRIGLQ
jgi:hypothetical protein